MPANDPILNSADDPYAYHNDDDLSAYEREEQQNRAQEARAAAIGRHVDLHRNEVERACSIRSDRVVIEAQRTRFENDSAYRTRIERARRARNLIVFTVGVILLIFLSDLFLGTPDLAEDLAHPVKSLIPESWLPETGSEEGESSATPNWLRLVIGMTLSTVALALTIAVKIVGDETPVHNARRRLSQGDAKGWRQVTIQLWTRRAIKIGYLAIMLAAFTWLYTYAEERARVMESLTAESGQELNWANLGSNLLSTEEGKDHEPILEDTSGPELKKGGKLALGAGATYAMLFILHALLLMLPTPKSTIDLPLASYNPHRAEAKAEKMRREEEGLLRGIVARIQTVRDDDSTRETLIILSEPVAHAVNELYGRTLMPIPETVGGDATTIDPMGSEVADSDVSDPDTDENEAFAYDSDEQDPAEAIFGKSA